MAPGPGFDGGVCWKMQDLLHRPARGGLGLAPRYRGVDAR